MLDMWGQVDDVMESTPDGGVTLIQAGSGGFYDYDNGGVWVPGTPTETELARVTIQPATEKAIELAIARGGTADPKDIRNVYINDGTEIFPADTGRESDYLVFTDGLSRKKWRVLTSDNRPWRNYCHVVVERTDQEVT